MAGKSENRYVNVYINGKQVENNFRGISSAINKTKNTLRGLTRGTKEYEDELKKLRRLYKMQDKYNADLRKTKKLTDQNTKSLKKFGIVAAVAFAASYVKSFLRGVVDVTKQFITFDAVLSNALGSKSEGRKSLKTLSDWAATTPIQVDEATGAFVKLVNRGFKPTMEEMTKMGDLAISQGKSLDQFVEAMLDAETGEFERLKEFGIRASKAGDQVTFSFKGVEKQVAFTADAIRDSLLEYGELEGVLGAMASISKELPGQISNFEDKITQSAYALGQKLAPAISNVISVSTELLDIVTQWFSDTQSEQIKQEIIDLQVLENRIYSVNTPAEERLELVKEFNEKYPGYLSNIDDDVIKNGELATALEQVNTALDNKYRIMVRQERLDKKLALQDFSAGTLAEYAIDSEDLIAQMQKELGISTEDLNARLTGKIDVDREQKGSMVDVGEVELTNKQIELIEKLRILQDEMEAQGKGSWWSRNFGTEADVDFFAQKLIESQALMNGVIESVDEAQKKLDEEKQRAVDESNASGPDRFADADGYQDAWAEALAELDKNLSTLTDEEKKAIAEQKERYAQLLTDLNRQREQFRIQQLEQDQRDVAQVDLKYDGIIATLKTKLNEELITQQQHDKLVAEYNLQRDAEHLVLEAARERRDQLALEESNRIKAEADQKYFDEKKALFDAYFDEKKLQDMTEEKREIAQIEAYYQSLLNQAKEYNKKMKLLGNDLSIDIEAITEGQEKARTAIHKKYSDARTKNAEDEAEKIKAINREQFDSVVSNMKAITSMIINDVNQHTKLRKAAVKAQFFADTASSISSMITGAEKAAALAGPLAPVAAAAYVAAGLARIYGNYATAKNTLKQMDESPADGEFKTGGYTGPGGISQVAGIVHKDEYVVPSHVLNTTTGANYVGMLEAIRINKRQGFADGGFTDTAGETKFMKRAKNFATDAAQNIGGVAQLRSLQAIEVHLLDIKQGLVNGGINARLNHDMYVEDQEAITTAENQAGYSKV